MFRLWKESCIFIAVAENENEIDPVNYVEQKDAKTGAVAIAMVFH